MTAVDSICAGRFDQKLAAQRLFPSLSTEQLPLRAQAQRARNANAECARCSVLHDPPRASAAWHMAHVTWHRKGWLLALSADRLSAVHSPWAPL
jgi:hypothetical protein